MKKTNKIIVALSILLVIVTICGCVFGTDISIKDLNSGTLTSDQTNGMSNFGKQIVAVVRNVGIIVSVVILLILGIKYMAGSAEEKADYKKSMIPYIVGAILIFASTTIVGIVVDMAKALNP